MGWKLVTSSQEQVDGWEAEAARLRRQLDAITACMATEYSEPLIWRSETMTAEQWQNLDSITAEILAERIRDEMPEQNLMAGAGATGLVQGYRGQLPNLAVASVWSVGSDRSPFNNILNFNDLEPDKGNARRLNEHEPAWLVRLLCEAAAAVGADEAKVKHGDLDDELADVREEASWHVGALTLFPNGIGEAELPESITAYPCPSGYPDGVVLVADLDRVITDPESLIPDLLRVHDLYQERTSPDR